MKLQQIIEFGHRLGLDGVHDVDIGAHGLVVGVSSPFHYHIRGNAQGESVDDEGAATGVSANLGPLGKNFVRAGAAFVGGDADLLVDGKVCFSLRSYITGFYQLVLFIPPLE